MKYLFTLFTFLILQNSFSQTKIADNHKIESLIQIWGVLKYQHPEVSKGIYNMNEEFIDEFDKIINVESREKFNEELLTWIKKFSNQKTVFKTSKDFLHTKSNFIKNADYKWIDNSGFSSELVSILKEIQNNSNIGDYYASKNRLSKMVSFKNEKGLEQFDLMNRSNRILFLSSFWNAMKYWNVNLYLTDQPWSSVLTEMISEFENTDEIKFEFAKDKLFSKLNDSHSDYPSSYLMEEKLDHFPYFGGRIINDSLVITNLYDKELAKKDNINLGDVVFSINEQSIKDYYNENFSSYISASNSNYLKRRIEKFFLLASDSDSKQIGIYRNDKSVESTYVKLNKSGDYISKSSETIYDQRKENYYKIKDEIGYLSLGKIKKDELKKAFKHFDKTTGLIIDLRNYPLNVSVEEMTKYLYPTKKVFIKILAPKSPSYGEYDFEAPLNIISNPFAAGSKNRNYYKGKVILLVDRSTASKAEFIGMAIQQAPNCITIGEQTAGAVMNRIRFTLIDKTTVDFTGMGAFYPDDRGLQRNGLKIDCEIKESASGYNPNLYIEEAINLLK